MAAPERILIVHNTYRQHGGEDAVVAAEVALLRQRGHEVREYRRDNAEISGMAKPRLLRDTLWSDRTTRELDALDTEFAPDLIHAHNTFPLISPSLYWAAARHRIPVVQTLHNFRLLCPQAMFLREGAICEDCLGHLPWRGAARRCYRGSLVQSGALAGMLTLHRVLGTWSSKVTRYIALNKFCRDKFVTSGLPVHRIAVKANFVDVPAPSAGPREGGLFVGRLSPEKGVEVLLRALKHLSTVSIEVIGAGPEANSLTGNPKIRARGALDPTEVFAAMGRAAWLIMPSICYETFGLVALEAFACGLPVIASRLGAIAELVEDGRTGLLFAPGDARDLAQKIAWAQTHPEEMNTMGENARREYEARYTPEINYRQLLAIYRDAMVEAAHE